MNAFNINLFKKSVKKVVRTGPISVRSGPRKKMDRSWPDRLPTLFESNVSVSFEFFLNKNRLFLCLTEKDKKIFKTYLTFPFAVVRRMNFLSFVLVACWRFFMT